MTGFDGVFALPEFDAFLGIDDATRAVPLANPVICVGNGFVLEDTIGRMQVFDTSSVPLTKAARQLAGQTSIKPDMGVGDGEGRSVR